MCKYLARARLMPSVKLDCRNSLLTTYFCSHFSFFYIMRDILPYLPGCSIETNQSGQSVAPACECATVIGHVWPLKIYVRP